MISLIERILCESQTCRFSSWLQTCSTSKNLTNRTWFNVNKQRKFYITLPRDTALENDKGFKIFETFVEEKWEEIVEEANVALRIIRREIRRSLFAKRNSLSSFLFLDVPPSWHSTYRSDKTRTFRIKWYVRLPMISFLAQSRDKIRFCRLHADRLNFYKTSRGTARCSRGEELSSRESITTIPRHVKRQRRLRVARVVWDTR